MPRFRPNANASPAPVRAAPAAARHKFNKNNLSKNFQPVGRNASVALHANVARNATA
jgi:hypothetical protein